jgi:hypothetical protein
MLLILFTLLLTLHVPLLLPLQLHIHLPFLLPLQLHLHLPFLLPLQLLLVGLSYPALKIVAFIKNPREKGVVFPRPKNYLT